MKVATEEQVTNADLKNVIFGDASIMALLEKATVYSSEAGQALERMKQQP